MIEVVQPGLLTTIQDTGRKGFEAYGVPRSGSFDPFLAAVANKLVGNQPGAALMEFALVGPTLRFHQNSGVAVTGFGIRYELDGKVAPVFSAISVQAGSMLRFVSMQGWFGYIAISGGIEAERVLGSVSTYLAGGIGKRVQKEDKLKSGPETSRRLSLRLTNWNFPEEPVLHILQSQHTSRFTRKERQKFSEQDYKISSQSNRMGIRLDGAASLHAPAIRRSIPALPGAVQIPRSGLPIILGPEGPTTGGYAQIAVLSRTSWTVLAGKRPGESIRFAWTDIETARRMWDERERLLRNAAAWQS